MPSKTIDRRLKVSWCLELTNGERWFDTADDERAWVTAKNIINRDKLSIKRMHLFAVCNAETDTTFGGALTPEYCQGYFFCRKLLAHFQGPSIHMFAIGYHEPGKDKVDVRWYDESMGLQQHEMRTLESIEIGYIENNL